MDAVSAKVGKPIADWQEADRELETFVEAAGPDQTEWIARVIHIETQMREASFVHTWLRPDRRGRGMSSRMCCRPGMAPAQQAIM